MTAAIAALFRHPIKGFTPEKLQSAALAPGEAFPGDRLYALEDGPCGFDPAHPAFIPKQRFAVLAKIAEVARARTRLDEATGLFHAEADGMPSFTGCLGLPEAREAFAQWAAELLGEAAEGPLRLIDGAGHRFLDHPSGHVSIINLASVRDLEQRLERPLDPLRFRANLYVEGWPAWAENDWTGRRLRLGEVEAEVFKPILRCAAPGVDPATAVRDLDIPAELFRLYGHALCGIYVQVKAGGVVREGDEIDGPDSLLPLREKVSAEPTDEQLCLSGVFWAPFLAGAEHGQDDAEHAPGDGDDGGFGCFAVGDEALVEGL